MKYKAIRSLYGDYGEDGKPRQIQPGEVFEAPRHLARQLEAHEANGIIERHVERPFSRKQYVVFQNKALTPGENKAIEPAQNKAKK